MMQSSVIEDLIEILQVCRQSKNLGQAMCVHAYMCDQEFDLHPVLVNFLVPTLVECGSLRDARHVFDHMDYHHRNHYSWNSLIYGYVDCGELQSAFGLYNKMQEAKYSVRPDTVTYLAVLNACARLKDAESGRAIHADIILRGLDGDFYKDSTALGNTLVDMYCKSTSISDARQVFDNLPIQDAVSWAALIAGYSLHDLSKEAGKCFQEMLLRGVSPDSVTFVNILKACCALQEIDLGFELHIETIKRGLEIEIHVGNMLVDMYCKCRLLAEAHQVISQLPNRDVLSWNTMITGYTKHGLSEEVMGCFWTMLLEGISPDFITFACTLKSCGLVGDLKTGQEIHFEAMKRGLESELHVGSTLIDMYIQCSSIAEAHHVFYRLPVTDVVSWNAAISGYAENGLVEAAANCLHQMVSKGISPDSYSLVWILKVCGSTGALEIGREVHGEATKRGLEEELHVGNSLVYMYSQCGLLVEMRQTFNRLPNRSNVSWNALISGYAEHRFEKEAVTCFYKMVIEGLSPDNVTFVSSLKACGAVGDLDIGQKLHCETTKRGLEREVVVGSTLVDMYNDCGLLLDARKAFDRLLFRNIVSWNALIFSYAKHGLAQEVAKCFREMLLEGISPDSHTLVCTLKACSALGALEMGLELHAEATKRGLQEDPHVAGTLVVMYTRCGLFAEVRQTLDRLPVRDAILWDTVFAECGPDKEVENYFLCMLLEGTYFGSDRFVCILKVFGTIGALETGQEVHSAAAKMGLEMELYVGSMLVHMYAKCGLLADARLVFDKLPIQTVVSWTTMINAYGINHKGFMAVRCFEDMEKQGVKPSSVTFISLLAACSHSSLIHEGQECFKLMKKYDIEPTADHVCCMVDMFARSGHIPEAERFVASMQCSPPGIILFTLLSSCRIYGKVEVGERCFKQLVELNQADSASYLLMLAIYISAGRLADAKRLEETTNFVGAMKKPASAFLEVNKRLHEFTFTND